MNSALSTVRVGKGRTEPLTWVLEHHGRPANLTTLDVSTVKFNLVRVDQWLGDDFEALQFFGSSTITKKVDNAACTITTAASGDIAWSPDTDDLDTPGRYYYQFKVTDGSGNVLPWPETPARMEVVGSIIG